MKQGKSEMPMHEKHAKMAVLHHLKSMAEDMMKGHMGDMKKVSVMSDSPEGLEHGLDKAKGLVGKLDSDEEGYGDHGGSESDPLEGEEEQELTRGDVNSPGQSSHSKQLFSENHSGEPEDGDMEDRDAVPGELQSPEHEASEHMSDDEIDAKIAHLKSLKKR